MFTRLEIKLFNKGWKLTLKIVDMTMAKTGLTNSLENAMGKAADLKTWCIYIKNIKMFVTYITVKKAEKPPLGTNEIIKIILITASNMLNFIAATCSPIEFKMPMHIIWAYIKGQSNENFFKIKPTSELL